jgi:hypothetical protein
VFWMAWWVSWGFLVALVAVRVNSSRCGLLAVYSEPVLLLATSMVVLRLSRRPSLQKTLNRLIESRLIMRGETAVILVE